MPGDNNNLIGPLRATDLGNRIKYRERSLRKIMNQIGFYYHLFTIGEPTVHGIVIYPPNRHRHTFRAIIEIHLPPPPHAPCQYDVGTRTDNPARDPGFSQCGADLLTKLTCLLRFVTLPATTTAPPTPAPGLRLAQDPGPGKLVAQRFQLSYRCRRLQYTT